LHASECTTSPNIRSEAALGGSITFLSLSGAVGKPLTFWIYAVFGLIAFAFTWFLVPETRGKRLEQIETYWEQGRTWSDQGRPTEPEPRRSA